MRTNDLDLMTIRGDLSDNNHVRIFITYAAIIRFERMT
jgi:hypothetical protein